MILLEFFLNFIGVVAFLVPGILISFILFPETDIIERTVYSLSLSIGCLGIISIFLYYIGLLNQFFFFIVYACLVLTVALIIFKKYNKETYKTEYKKPILFILLFSLLGTIFRYLFEKSILNPNNPYAYSFKFIGNKVPNLGYYTGMALDKSEYVGNITTGKILEYFYMGSGIITIFLTVFLFLGFIFLVFREYRQDQRLAYLGVAIMAMGPIELFYSNTSIYGHSLSYIVLLPLFLLFKSKNTRIFWLALLFSIVMMITYYTSSVIIILCCSGFLLALLIKSILETKSIKKTFFLLLKDKKFLYFLIILFIIFLYVFFFSKMSNYSFGMLQDSSYLKIATKNLSLSANTLYKDPTFLFLSAIRWQMVFFFLCGLTFIFHLLLKRKISKEDSDLLLCLIPVAIISYGFWYTNLPARIFDYFAFFGLMNFKLPQKYFKSIFFVFLIFILISGFFIARDKKVFLSITEKETMGAKEIKNIITEKIFSDEVFANQLILNGYYNVTGANDKDQLVKNLFYQNDKNTFLNSINYLKQHGVNYVAITKRMREKYILMVNFPQKPIFDFDMYQNNLKKIYDNGDVNLYSTDIKK